MPDLIPVDFHGNQISTCKDETTQKVYCLPREIVTQIGANWSGQYTKLTTSRLYKPHTRCLDVQTPGGRQTVLLLDIDYLPAWLGSISTDKVDPAIRDRLLAYQEECVQVLRDYWTKGAAINPRQMESASDLTIAKQHLGLLIDLRAFLQADGMYDDLTKLTFAVQAKQLAGIADRTALPAAAHNDPPLWSVSMRLAHQGLLLHGAAYDTAVQHIGKRMATRYRNAFGTDPQRLWDHVKGQMRHVNAYDHDALPLLDELIRDYRQDLTLPAPPCAE